MDDKKIDELKKKRDQFIAKVIMKEKATELKRQMAETAGLKADIKEEAKNFYFDYEHSNKLGAFFRAHGAFDRKRMSQLGSER
jgi:hypothetical protein